MTREEQIKQAAIGRYGNNGNESQYMLGKIQAFMVGARYADEHPDSCQIKWQKGKPKEEGVYLVTTISGEVKTSTYMKAKAIDFGVFSQDVVAWCKLSDIVPYKEEKK